MFRAALVVCSLWRRYLVVGMGVVVVDVEVSGVMGAARRGMSPIV